MKNRRLMAEDYDHRNLVKGGLKFSLKRCRNFELKERE